MKVLCPKERFPALADARDEAVREANFRLLRRNELPMWP
jgi:hypothetical protein